MLRLKTLGRLSLWRDAAKVPAAGCPENALPFLAILAVAGERAVSADDLVALLWPDDARDAAGAKLDALVAALPGWLAGVQPVQGASDGFRLDQAVIACDARDFEFAAASGAPDQASRLFEGPFLEDAASPSRSFERWREREAARFAQIAKWTRDAMRPRRSKAQLNAGAQIGHGGRYRIDREIGVGGAATVYLAHDSRHDRPVAIKVLREDVSETISPERFEKEIKFVAQLQHPHILPLFDSGEHGSALYSVMPYVDGETVRQRITRDGKLPLDDAVRIAAGVADALAYAHEHKVLHRDVKPENILLSDGHPLLTDFGIARTVDPNATGRTTLPGVVLGTVPYMSPEQATGESDLDGRTDVYALGAVLYEMLSGKPPFAGEPSRRMMTRRLTEVPPRVSKMGVTLPVSVDEILLRALQPSAADRATARELADALSLAERHLTGEAKARSRKRSMGPALITAAAVVVLGAVLFASRCAGIGTAAPIAAADTTLLQRMLVAEDARGKGRAGIAPLLEGAKSRNATVRRVAIRGIGRLQLQSMVATIGPFLGDESPAVRREAANAIAQSVSSARRGPGAPASTRTAVRDATRLLTRRLAGEKDRSTMGVLVRSLGRLPVPDTADARAIEGVIYRALTKRPKPGRLKTSPEDIVRKSLEALPATAAHDVAEGLYALARARRQLGGPSTEAMMMLRSAALYRADARVRGIGVLGLGAADAFDSASVLAASGDADPDVRRLALTSISTLSSGTRAAVVQRALADTSAMVRLDAIRAARTLADPPDCTPLIAATRDASPHVALAAIDALGLPCADDRARAQALRAIANALPGTDVPRVSGKGSWHAGAHAIVSLARVDIASATPLLPRFTAHPRAQVREYAARAAAQLNDAPTLLRLAADRNHNVQESAIAGLSRVRKHDADSVFIAALESPGYQVVRAAAAALAGSTHAGAVPALATALDRLGAERRENSRDARMALLARLAELGKPADAARIEKHISDFDTTVAARAAELVMKLRGGLAGALPSPLPIAEEPLAQIFASRALQLRITMDASSGGGTFTVRLFADEAPATVARIVRLARAHRYDGLSFHRVVPNFVIQGGSPDANEYVGDGPFMRDELGLRSHDRGTLGISTRGRDTGDAQLFVNLVDNPRLDHDYTVFGEVVSGMAVVDGILEGDVIVKVEVLTATASRQ